MINLQTVLFPHTTIGEKDLKRIIFLFSPLTIFQPWYMELHEPIGKYADKSLIKTLYPPEHLKPEKDVREILNGYENWIRQFDEKDYAGSLRASLKFSISEEHSWDIRKNLYGSKNFDAEKNENKCLKWHVLLHLAKRLEQSRSDAYELLNLARGKKPPLEEALEEKSSSPGLLDDLSKDDTFGHLDAYHISEIIYAWLGLFGNYLSEFDILITLDNAIMSTVMEILEEKEPDEPGLPTLPSAHLILPNLKQIDFSNSEDLGKNALAERASESLTNIFTLLKRQKEGYKDSIEELSKLFQAGFKNSDCDENMEIDIVFINKIPSGSKKAGETGLGKLTGKFLICLGKNGL